MNELARIDTEQERNLEHAKSHKRVAWGSGSICILLAAITLVCFWPVTHGKFTNYDDSEYVTSNPHVQSGLMLRNAAWAFGSYHASNWHPLTWLSHMLDVELFGKGPTGPHCVNLLLHLANTVFLFLLLRRLTGAQWRSAIVAALFALHPLHVESVAWVAERKDVLSTFFWMLTLLAYARYVDGLRIRCSVVRVANPEVQGSRLPPWSFYSLALACFALGLMSKPMVVTLPFVMLLLDYWPLGRSAEPENQDKKWSNWGRLVVEKWPFFMMSAVSCVVTSLAQKNAMQTLDHLPLKDRIANAVVAYEGYVAKTLWPTGLALPYLHPGHWPAMQVTVAAIVTAGLCVAAVMMARRYPFFLTGWFWYLGTLVPVIGLVQVGAQSMADRYTYVPLIGIFIVLVWGAGELCMRLRLPKPAMGAAAATILIGCGWLTRVQAGYWHDTETLFMHAAKVTDNNFVALSNVGGSLFERGKLDEAMGFYQRAYQSNPRYAEAVNSIGAVLAARESDEAIEWFRKALALQPRHPDALFNMGNAMAKKGNLREAAEYFQASLQVKPDNYEGRNNLGNAFVKLGRIDDAILQYRLALEYKPEATLIHRNLGEMLAAKGKLDEAISQYREALIGTNDAATHYSLGMTLAVQGRWDEAIEHYEETLRLSPTNAEAHYNLGYALRMKGWLDKAAAHLREALRLRSQFPLAHYNLGCVLADQGQRDEALTELNEALREQPGYEEARAKLRSLTAPR